MFHRKLAKAALIVGSASYMSRDDSHRKTSLSMFQSRPLLKPKVAFSPTSIPAVPAPVMADVTKPAGKRAPEDKGEYYYGLLENAVRKPIGSHGDFEYHYVFPTLAEAEKARDAIAPETEIIHLHTLGQYLLVLTEEQQKRLGADHHVFAAIKANNFPAVRDFARDYQLTLAEFERLDTGLKNGDFDPIDPRDDGRAYSFANSDRNALKAKLEVKNHKNQTPFEYAVQQGRWDCVQVLLDNITTSVWFAVPYDDASIIKAIAEKRYDLLPFLHKKRVGGSLSEEFAAVLSSNDWLAIYNFLLARRRAAIYTPGDRPGDLQNSGHFYRYSFDNAYDAHLARMVLNTDAGIFIFIDYREGELSWFEVNISKEDFYKEESCFREVDTRRRTRSGSFFEYFKPTPEFTQCPLGKSWLDKR